MRFGKGVLFIYTQLPMFSKIKNFMEYHHTIKMFSLFISLHKSPVLPSDPAHAECFFNSFLYIHGFLEHYFAASPGA
jgi:hypothetical protein